MNYRSFGRTGLKVSEVGFGAWAIGGAYGAVDRAESLNALARAEELGCNFVDTAAVYGDSENVLGEFLRGRREKWLVATKYSAPKLDMERCLDEQLRRLSTDHVDLYQLHWAAREPKFYEQLERLKQAGKIRHYGVSVYNADDIAFVLNQTAAASIQLPCSLLEPRPYVSCLPQIRAAGIGVIIRSCLREGFLTGKFSRDAVFADPSDQRHGWSRADIAAAVAGAEQFRYLERHADSLMLAAARYPLAFPETSTLILGTKTAQQAAINFGAVPAAPLPPAALAKIRRTQLKLGLLHRYAGWLNRAVFRLLTRP